MVIFYKYVVLVSCVHLIKDKNNFVIFKSNYLYNRRRSQYVHACNSCIGDLSESGDVCKNLAPSPSSDTRHI